MRRIGVTFILLGLGVSLHLNASARADLVVNGGFETGDFTGWTLDGSTADNFVLSGFSHSGNYAAWFGEQGRLGAISQVLSTVAGTTYHLSFWFAGDGDTPSQFQALVGSTVLLDLVNPPFDLDYLPYSYNFTATSSSTTLTFKFRDDPFFINLDDVSVTAAVPEPSPALLISTSLILGGLVRVARKRLAPRAAA